MDKKFDLSEKPLELMTDDEKDEYFLKRTGKTYNDFVKDIKPLTDEERKKYGLIK